MAVISEKIPKTCRYRRYVEKLSKTIDMQKIIFIIILISFVGCNKNTSNNDEILNDVCLLMPEQPHLYIIIRPYDNIPKLKENVENFMSFIKNLYKYDDYAFEIDSIRKLPNSCLNKSKTRFRAEKILRFQNNNNKNKRVVVLGLTTKDISTSIHNTEDYGIIGMSYKPGNSCIVSTFRTGNKYYKHMVHEFLHAQGLGHCSNDNCIMADAKGKGLKMKYLCDSCINKIRQDESHRWW